MSKVQSESNRNILTLMTGTTIAQAIPIAISPILTRIYTPEDFGLFALFFAITAILGSISSARYELAIILPRKDDDAINLFALGVILTSLISIIIFILIILFHNKIIMFFDNQEIGLWLYFIPFSVFFIGLFNLLSYFNTRKKNYKDIARATIIKSIILAIVQVSLGLLKNGATGLITGEVISRISANIKLFKNIITNKILVSKINKIKILVLMKKYKQFPKFSVWATLANSLSSHIVSLFISIFYNFITLGFYSLAEKVLGVPTSLIGRSISQVFFQQATQERLETKYIIKTFNSTIKKLVVIGFLLFGSLFFLLEDLFAFIFGEDWRIAGAYAQVLTVLYLIRFIVSPVTVVPIILNKVKVDLYFQLIMLILIIILILTGFIFQLNTMNFISLFSFTYSLYYLVYFIYLNLLVRSTDEN